ncbi:unnamed protein product, partial [Closterium sp. NIES-65]
RYWCLHRAVLASSSTPQFVDNKAQCWRVQGAGVESSGWRGAAETRREGMGGDMECNIWRAWGMESVEGGRPREGRGGREVGGQGKTIRKTLKCDKCCWLLACGCRADHVGQGGRREELGVVGHGGSGCKPQEPWRVEERLSEGVLG